MSTTVEIAGTLLAVIGGAWVMSKVIRTCGRAKVLTEQLVTGLGFDPQKLTLQR